MQTQRPQRRWCRRASLGGLGCYNAGHGRNGAHEKEGVTVGPPSPGRVLTASGFKRRYEVPEHKLKRSIAKAELWEHAMVVCHNVVR